MKIKTKYNIGDVVYTGIWKGVTVSENSILGLSSKIFLIDKFSIISAIVTKGSDDKNYFRYGLNGESINEMLFYRFESSLFSTKEEAIVKYKKMFLEDYGKFVIQNSLAFVKS